MYKITVKGEARTDYSNPAELDGIDCQDSFGDYLDDDFPYFEDVEEGYMHFSYEEGKLWTYTTYTAKRKLTEEELESLKEYTQGQWSDGIGEGFEQYPCYERNGEEAYISPWFRDQQITITQTLEETINADM